MSRMQPDSMSSSPRIRMILPPKTTASGFFDCGPKKRGRLRTADVSTATAVVVVLLLDGILCCDGITSSLLLDAVVGVTSTSHVR